MKGESLAHGRSVLCSTGAGAADLVAPDARFAPGDVDALSGLLEKRKQWHVAGQLDYFLMANRWFAENYTWTKIRERYQTLWRDVLK